MTPPVPHFVLPMEPGVYFPTRLHGFAGPVHMSCVEVRKSGTHDAVREDDDDVTASDITVLQPASCTK